MDKGQVANYANNFRPHTSRQRGVHFLQKLLRRSFLPFSQSANPNSVSYVIHIILNVTSKPSKPKPKLKFQYTIL